MRPQPISSSIQKEKFWTTKVHSKKTYDVVISGDSRVYRGIDPSKISEGLEGLEVLNFGFSSGGHNPLIFREVEKKFNIKAKNKIVVLALTPYSLTPKAQENGHFKQEKNRDQKEVFLRRYVNPALNFFDPIKPTDFIYANDTTQGYYEKFRPDGWVESKKIPFNNRAALKSYVKDFENNHVSKAVVDQMLLQVKLWVSQGIYVFAIRMPTTKEMELLENELSGYKENKIRNDFEEAGGRWISYEDRYDFTSYDGSHLDGESAKLFSEYIGKKIYSLLE